MSEIATWPGVPRCWFVLLVAALPAMAARGDEQQELTKLQGNWKAEKALRDGNEDRSEMRVELTGRKLTILANNKVMAEAEIALDGSATPAQIDLKLKVEGMPTAKGIYAVDGDRLRLCWARGGGDRPKEFTSKVGTKSVLLELKREKK